MFLYNIGILLLGLAVRTLSLFQGKARLWVSGRRGVFKKLPLAFSAEDRVVWVHCASLGEFEQGRPVIEQIRRQRPEYKILLTFFSPSGYEIRKNYADADHICYLPLDTPRNARRFLRAVHPEVAIFVKYEFWLNYLHRLPAAGCRTFIISSIFRPRTIFFKWYGGAFRRALATFEKIFVQDERSLELLGGIGICNVVVAGDTRFDRVAEIAAGAKSVEAVERFSGGRKLFIAGSTWPDDERLLLELAQRRPELKFVIVPHEIEEQRIAGIAEASPRKVIRYTQIDADTDLRTAEILIIDTIGILSSVYRYAALGYIGGGFGVGIHNTLEAAVYGIPIAFGPNYGKFREAVELIAAGVAKSISNIEELGDWAVGLLADPGLYDKTCREAAGYVDKNKGATKEIMAAIFS